MQKFLAFLAIFHIFCIYHFIRDFFSLCKKYDMWEMRNVRNNAIWQIAINCMQEIFKKLIKIKKFEKCNNYCTCLALSIVVARKQGSSYLVKLYIWTLKILSVQFSNQSSRYWGYGYQIMPTICFNIQTKKMSVYRGIHIL